MIRGPRSLRDPAGTLIESNDRVLRLVFQEGRAQAEALLASTTISRWQADGRFVRTDVLNDEEARRHGAVLVLEHDRITFPSYPGEWSPAMLADAGRLTLELAEELAREGLGLKDATPLNVLFRGSQAVFIDALSIERRKPTDPTWLAYGQFVRSFLLPLVASIHLGWSMRRTFTGARDGLSPEDLIGLLPLTTRLRPTVFGLVTGPTLLARIVGDRRMPTSISLSPSQATHALRGLISRTRRALEKCKPDARPTPWTTYTDPSVHPPHYHEARRHVVQSVLAEVRPRFVLDVGTNDGEFALLAAGAGCQVVAIDRDESVIDAAYRRASAARATVLPLVVDLADPTPATGWRGTERASFLDRARGRFDAVLCLAVLHHLVVGDGLPVESVFEHLAELTNDVLIAEFVPPDDPFCRRLARGREVKRDHWSREAFVDAASRWFDVRSAEVVSPSGRELLVMRRKREQR